MRSCALIAGLITTLLACGCEMGSRDRLYESAKPLSAHARQHAFPPSASKSDASVGTLYPQSPARPSAPSSQVIKAQQLLLSLGYDPGTVDGAAGERTRSAVKRFQQDHGLMATGRVTPALLAELGQAAATSPQAPAPQQASEPSPAPISRRTGGAQARASQSAVTSSQATPLGRLPRQSEPE